MQTVAKHFRNLGLPPGHWQLISYGRIEGQPSIKAAIWITALFRKVSVDVKDNILSAIKSWHRGHGSIAKAVLPAAEMVAYEIGCIFDSATYIMHAAQRLSTRVVQTEVEVEFTTENCVLVRRHMRGENGYFAFKNEDIEFADTSNAYLLLVTCTNGKKILIPCTTVLQTFWGRSSKLLSMLLDTRFLDFNRYVINTEKSRLDEINRRAYIWLRQWSENEDARFISTIAFDKEALLRGKEIAMRLCSMPPDFEDLADRYIVALPPHSQKVVLKVLGLKVLSTNLGEYTFIQRVIESSYRPPFDRLTFDRDNDNRQEQQILEEEGLLEQRTKLPINRENYRPPVIFEGSTEFELTSDFPNSKNTSNSVLAGTFDQMFPGITNLKAKQAPQFKTTYANDPERQAAESFRQWEELLSVLPSTTLSASTAAKTTLSSAKLVRDYLEDTNTEDLKIYLNHLVDEYDDYDRNSRGEEQDICIGKRFPWRQSPAHGGSTVFSLPASIDDQYFAWLYSDPDQTTRKRAICLEVTFLSRSLARVGVGYIIDIEVRHTKSRSSKVVDQNGETTLSQNINSTSMVFVWKDSSEFRHADENEEVSDFEIRKIIEAMAVCGSYAGAKEYFPEGCLTQPRKHSKEGISIDKLLDELKVCVLGVR